MIDNIRNLFKKNALVVVLVVITIAIGLAERQYITRIVDMHGTI